MNEGNFACDCDTDMQENMWARLRDSRPGTHVIHANLAHIFSCNTGRRRRRIRLSIRTHKSNIGVILMNMRNYGGDAMPMRHDASGKVRVLMKFTHYVIAVGLEVFFAGEEGALMVYE